MEIVPKRILCKIKTHDSYTNELDGEHYTVYDNSTFVHSSWDANSRSKRKVPMEYKIESGFFYYRDIGQEGWKCDCIDGDHEPDDLLLITSIEEAIEKKYIFGDDSEH